MARNVDLLQRVRPDTPVPNSDWNTHEVAAHLVCMAGRYLRADRKLAGSQRELQEMNQQELEEFTSATMGELVGRLRSRNAKYAVFWTEQPLDAVFPYRTGFSMDAGTLRSNWITELMIHGRDIALANGEPWTFDDTSGLLSLRLLAHVLHTYVRPDGKGDAALTVAASGGSPFSLVITNGVPDIAAVALPDADQLAGSPSALTLLLYGRIDLAEAQAMGITVTGDAGRVQRLLDRLEKP